MDAPCTRTRCRCRSDLRSSAPLTRAGHPRLVSGRGRKRDRVPRPVDHNATVADIRAQNRQQSGRCTAAHGARRRLFLRDGPARTRAGRRFAASEATAACGCDDPTHCTDLGAGRPARVRSIPRGTPSGPVERRSGTARSVHACKSLPEHGQDLGRLPWIHRGSPCIARLRRSRQADEHVVAKHYRAGGECAGSTGRVREIAVSDPARRLALATMLSLRRTEPPEVHCESQVTVIAA